MKAIVDEIEEIKRENLEQLFYMAYYTLKNYIKSVLKYGSQNKITYKNKELFQTFVSIQKEENLLLNLLLKNRKKINIGEAYAFLDSLDELNEKTMQYFYQYLDDLEVAYSLGEERRTKEPLKKFETLLETEKYRREIIRMLLKEDVLKDFFAYPDEFWEYVTPRICQIEEIAEGKAFYAVYVKTDEENKIKNIKVYVPKIIDLETLLINIHEINHAYLLYKNLNQPLCQEEEYERLAKEAEQFFLESYFDEAYRKVFKRKNQFT